MYVCIYKFKHHHFSSCSDEQRLFELFLNDNTFAVIFGDIFKFQQKKSHFSLILPIPTFYIQLNKTKIHTTFQPWDNKELEKRHQEVLNSAVHH